MTSGFRLVAPDTSRRSSRSSGPRFSRTAPSVTRWPRPAPACRSSSASSARTVRCRATTPSRSPTGHPRAGANLVYAERLVKFLLWARGGWKVYVGGPPSVGQHVARVYAADGARAFDHFFMGEQVHGRPFTVVVCDADDVPAAREGASRSAAIWTAAASGSISARRT